MLTIADRHKFSHSSYVALKYNVSKNISLYWKVLKMFNSGKSQTPDNTAFKQQRLPAWQPIVSAKAVFPSFIVLSFLFIPIGAVLLITSQNVVELIHDYTDCDSLEDPDVKCSFVRLDPFRMNETCTCRVNFTIDTSLTGDVFAFYGLSNFFQNHRRYVKSRDDYQLNGRHIDITSINGDCFPYAARSVNGTVSVAAPCGAIANSLFNDTFSFSLGSTTVPFVRTGIAWPTDHSKKFNNPSPTNDLEKAFILYEKPLFWQTAVQHLDNTSISNNGYKNEALIVWMRTAAFPHFRKLYGRLDRGSNIDFVNGLRSGDYSVMINYNYPVTAFFGRKRFILSTTSWMGGKNDFLGIAYISFGCLFFLIGVILCCIHFYAQKIHVQVIN